MKRVIDDARTGDGDAPSEHSESEEPGDRGSEKTVVPPCFVSQPEGAEVEEGAKNRSPSSDLVRTKVSRVHCGGPGDLDDVRVITVNIGPGRQWVKTRHSVGDD